MSQIEQRLENLGKTIPWLVSEFRKRDFEIAPQVLLGFINGEYKNPTAECVLRICDEILTEAEVKL